MTVNNTQKKTLISEDLIKSLAYEGKKKDGFQILEMMKDITGEQPKMWGISIIGFGDVHYKYASGREDDCFKAGFSPRKAKIAMYLMGCDIFKANNLVEQLGTHKVSKGCLSVNELASIDLIILKEMIKEGYRNRHIRTENYL
jgi:hypothetical protein